MSEEVLEQGSTEGTPADAADADFARGFAKASGEELPAEVKDEPKEAPKVEPAPSAEAAPAQEETAAPAVDPNDELRKQIAASVMAEITPTLRNLGGQIGGLNRELKNALTAAKQSAAASGSEAPTDKQIAAAAEDPEEWKKLKEEFPEFSIGVAKYVAAQVAATRSQPAQTVDPEAIRSQVINELAPKFEQQLGQTREQAMKEARVYARIDSAVGEGWEDTMRSSEFGAWFEKLPADKKQKYDSFNAPDVIACMKEFGTYQEAAKARQAKTERMKAAVQVESTGAGGPPVLTDEDAFKRGFARVAGR